MKKILISTYLLLLVMVLPAFAENTDTYKVAALGYDNSGAGYNNSSSSGYGYSTKYNLSDEAQVLQQWLYANPEQAQQLQQVIQNSPDPSQALKKWLEANPEQTMQIKKLLLN